MISVKKGKAVLEHSKVQSISIITLCNIPHFAVLWEWIEKLQRNVSIELPPHQLNCQRKKCDTAKVKFRIEERGRKNKLHNSISYCHLEDFPPKLQQPQSLSRSAPSHLSQCVAWQRQGAYAPIVTGWKMVQHYPCTDVDFDLCLSIHRQQMIFQKSRPETALCPSWRQSSFLRLSVILKGILCSNTSKKIQQLPVEITAVPHAFTPCW